MLKSISWSDYLTTVIFLLAAYYIYVALRYYRVELLRIAGIHKVEKGLMQFPITALNATDALPVEKNNQTHTPDDVDITPVVEAFLAEAEAYLEQASTDRTVKQEILYGLQRISARYPILSNPGYGGGLEKDIERLATQLSHCILTAAEIKPYLFT
jgi:hypothetical protein